MRRANHSYLSKRYTPYEYEFTSSPIICNPTVFWGETSQKHVDGWAGIKGAPIFLPDGTYRVIDGELFQIKSDMESI